MTAPVVATGRWELDPTASTARFVAHHLGRSVPGTIPFLSATCHVDDDGLPQRLAARLDLAAIATGNVRRDRDLAKPGLLDTTAHPVLTVELTDVAPTRNGWTASAIVNARGRSAPVEVTIVSESGGLPDDVMFRVRGRLDRTPLGMRAPRFAIGRWVDLDVTVRFTRRPARTGR